MAIPIDNNSQFPSLEAETVQITVTERAANRIKFILENESNQDQVFRVSVLGGGCSGFQYSFKFDHETAPDDIFIDKNSIRVAIDPISANYLNGSEIDYTDELIGATFVITNPNAVASCGCGTSFSLG